MNKKQNFFARFLQEESAGGIILMISAVLAIIVANSSLNQSYRDLLDMPVHVVFGQIEIKKNLLLWVNDGLMAGFFFLVGLELKREFLDGELSNPKNIIMPALGALGGMIVPALVYVLFNYDDQDALQGWAIPAATDIAFALGVLALLGSRVPISLKVFLTSLAIFDDVGAIIIIALFYTSKISMIALLIVVASLVALFFISKMGVTRRSVYIFVGSVMWVAMLKSGVHATLAGVLLAFFIPIFDKNNPDHSPLKSLEHDLHGAIAFIILPIFAFFNAGISLEGVGLKTFIHPVSLGISAGLFIGKTVGIFTFCWLAIKLKILSFPDGFNFKILFGVSALCGIGFTMSLFIGGLAFEELGNKKNFDERIGIVVGSIVSGLVGYLLLAKFLPAKDEIKATH